MQYNHVPKQFIRLKNSKKPMRCTPAIIAVCSVLCITLMAVSANVAALNKSLPAAKIDFLHARGLTGKGIQLGQLEPTHASFTHDMLKDVSRIVNPDGAGTHPHTTHVAGILVGQEHVSFGTTYKGVAPGATLQSTGMNPGILAAIDWLVLAPQVDIINMSVKNSTANVTEMADWVSAEKDVLFVKSAGNGGYGDGPLPDSVTNPGRGYNVLTVGALGGKAGTNDKTEDYTQLAGYSAQGLDSDNAFNPDIVAPGSRIASTVSGFTDGVVEMNGTSYAAPHVSGTAALLYEYSNNKSWGADTRDHKVMKAVLMNSANKAVKDKAGRTWAETEANTTETQALDDQLGTGGLDAKEAYDQYAAGEQGPGDVSDQGWDYFSGLTTLTSQYYNLEDKIVDAAQVLTATLVWDRQVERVDDIFNYKGLDDLDLWLWQGDNKGDLDTRLSSLSSYGFNNTTEHIYSLLSSDYFYTIEVDWFTNASELPNLNYALAWSVGTVPIPGALLFFISGFGGLVVIGRRRNIMA